MKVFTTRRRGGAIAYAAAAALVVPFAAPLVAPLAAQGAARATLDRTVPPPVGATPTLRVPAWTEETLSNGARLIVAPKRDLPLVSFTITFEGGANQFEGADKVGLAGMTAQLLSEGTTSMTGEELSEAQQLLGTSIAANIGGERGSIGFTALSDRFAPALALLADMMLNPTLPEDALERLRARTLVNLAQARDQPGVIANNVFVRTVFGTEHPYGRFTTEQTVRAITRDDVVAFHRAFYQPQRAIITVTGDVDAATVRAELERALASWPRGAQPASFAYPRAPEPGPRAIYLVDKPGAAQSSIYIGHPGPARDTPDFFALQVMNRILGGHFQSRLNHNIREVKGYSYGVGSTFQYGKGPGAFLSRGDVVAAKTDSSLIEFMRELQGVLGERPFTEEEITEAKDAIIQGLPNNFGSVRALSNSITEVYVQNLPRDYFERYADNIRAVTIADLNRVARQYVNPDRFAIIVVGDRASIEAPVKATGIAPVVVLDAEGRRVE